MKSVLFCGKLTLFVLLVFFTVKPTYAGVFLRDYDLKWVSQGATTFQLSGAKYQTEENYNSSGDSQAVSGLSEYNRTFFDLKGAYGLKENFSVFAKLNFTKVDFTKTTGAAGDTGSFGEQSFGAVYKFLQSENTYDGASPPWSLYAQAWLDVPFYSNNADSDPNAPYVGDGTTDFTLMGLFDYNLTTTDSGVVSARGGFGYQWRSDSFSANIPYSLFVRYDPTIEQGIVAKVGLSGIHSLETDDSNPNSTTNLNITSTHAAGSYWINAINPSITNAEMMLGYQWSPKWKAELTYLTSLQGESAPAGNLWMIGVTYRSVSSSLSSSSGYSPEFSSAAMQAKVVGVSDRLSLVKIDQGSSSGIYKGLKMDIFDLDERGNARNLVAHAEVTQLRSNEAILTVREYVQEVYIQKGFLVRRGQR